MKPNTFLTTRILEDDIPIAYHFQDTQYNQFQRRFIIKSGIQEVGAARYSMESSCFWIHRMDNYSITTAKPLKNVGTALFEWVFKQSLQNGKQGKIELNAIEAAGPAYFRMGFRKKGDGAVLLDKELEAYRRNPKEANKVAISCSSSYRFLQEDAQKYLHKNSVSFDEVIQYGIFSPLNTRFAELMSNRARLTASECYAECFTGIMYIPEEQIAPLTQKFLSFIPIGSNRFFSENFALSTLRSHQLKILVQSGEIDSSNAVEIEAKYLDEKSLKLLISPLGLKMMRSNYISAWYIGVYFAHDDIEKILSEKALLAFEQGVIKNITAFVNDRGLLYKICGDGLSAS